MYYSYKCSYCGRVFYTYDNDRDRAAHTLYASIKQHLIDYDEDHKEYEFDDGEEEESNDIYKHMVESKYRPEGAYEATVTSVSESDPSTTTSSSSSSSGYASTSVVLIILFLVVIVIIGVLYLNPSLRDYLLSFIS